MSLENDLRAHYAAQPDDPAAERRLRQLFDHPTADQAFDRGSTSRRPRLSFVPAAASVAVICVVAAAAIASHGTRHAAAPTVGSASSAAAEVTGPTPEQPCMTSKIPTFDTLEIAPVAGLDTTKYVNETTCSGYRARALYTPSGASLGQVVAFAPGAFDTSILKGAQPVSGSGISGYVADVPGYATSMSCNQASSTWTAPATSGADDCAQVSSLVWEYAPGSWAAISPDGGNDVATAFYGTDRTAKALTIAAAVRPADSLPLVMPFRLTAVPPHLHAVSATSAPDGTEPAGYGALGDVSFGIAGEGAGCQPTATCTTAVDVTVMYTIDTGLGDGLIGQHITINGHPAILVNNLAGGGPPAELVMQVDHWSVDINVTQASAGVTEQDLRSLAAGLQFAPSYTDATQWFTAAAALPH